MIDILAYLRGGLFWSDSNFLCIEKNFIYKIKFKIYIEFKKLEINVK